MSISIFNPVIDWMKQPSQSLEPYRTPFQYPGSGLYLRKITDDVQIKFSISLTSLTKKAESDILSFFFNHKGRLNAFWVPVPKNYFTATVDIGTTDTLIRIKDVSPIWLRGYERCFILRNDGTLFFNKIIGLTSSTLTIDAPLGQTCKVNEIIIFGKMIYARFDQDEIVMQHTTTAISECDLSFIELPKETPLS